MRISTDIEITVNRKHEVWAAYKGAWKKYEGSDARLLETCKSKVRSKYVSDYMKQWYVDKAATILDPRASTKEVKPEIKEDIKPSIDTGKVKTMIENMIKFFSEFNFEPNFRFINTVVRNSHSKSSCRNYIMNYFKLTDNPAKDSVQEKMKSSEWTLIEDDIISLSTSKQVNSRFKLYYGSAGTGKTTSAMAETLNNVMVCHSAMLPSDLMEDFKFNDGKAEFVPSSLYKAMVEGKPIVLDEINLLPFESLRFLQTILDNKPQIEYKGKIIDIKDGFYIIGTMNLTVNGNIFSLPEPLVDRAYDLKEFKLTAENLIGAII